jgi:hypothetical protein
MRSMASSVEIFMLTAYDECNQLPSTCLHLKAMTERRRDDMSMSLLLGVGYVYLGQRLPKEGLAGA